MKLSLPLKLHILVALLAFYFFPQLNLQANLPDEIAAAVKYLDTKKYDKKYEYEKLLYDLIDGLSDTLDSPALTKTPEDLHKKKFELKKGQGINNELISLIEFLRTIHAGLEKFSNDHDSDKEDEQRYKKRASHIRLTTCDIMRAYPYLDAINKNRRVYPFTGELEELLSILFDLYSVNEALAPNINYELCDEETFINSMHSKKEICGCPMPFSYADTIPFLKEYWAYISPLVGGLWWMGYLDRRLPARIAAAARAPFRPRQAVAGNPLGRANNAAGGFLAMLRAFANPPPPGAPGGAPGVQPAVPGLGGGSSKGAMGASVVSAALAARSASPTLTETQTEKPGVVTRLQKQIEENARMDREREEAARARDEELIRLMKSLTKKHGLKDKYAERVAALKEEEPVEF